MPFPGAPAPFEQVWETIANQMRQSILSGEVSAGMKLPEAELAQRFGVSRGPIREALRELAREGLVVDLPRRGTFVCTMNQTDLREVYIVREALEASAARIGVVLATDAELEHVAEAHVAMDLAWREAEWNEAIATDMDFHRAIIRLAKNGRLAEAYERMAAQTLLLLVQAAEHDVSLRGRPHLKVHAAIASAIAARDADAVTAAVGEHYRYTEHRLFVGVVAKDPAAVEG